MTEATVELWVERIGAGGDGIAEWRGDPVYLPLTAPGDRVRARLGRRRGGGREGRVVEVIAAGPGRIAAPCLHFGRCGGCALQHLDAAHYRAAKLDALDRALRRAGIPPDPVQPLQSVPPARRRAKLGLLRPRNPGRTARLGFRARFSRELIDLRACVVLEPALFALVAPLRSLAADLLLEMREAPRLAALEALAGFAAAHDLARIVCRVDGEDIPVVERRPVRIQLSGVAVPFPPGGFVQASEAAEALLVAAVVAGVGGRRPALDLYAGLGTFSFALAQRGPVHAVEGDRRAAAALARAAAAIPGVSVERRDLDRDPLPPAALAGYAAAIFDPPRAGAHKQAAALAAAPFDTVVAVSCNPATFARDARLLLGGGFRLEVLVPVDQFVWTPHLELVAVFRR